VLVGSGRPEPEPKPEPAPIAKPGRNLRGELDPSFGNSGFAAFERAPGEQRFSSVAALPDGAVVGAGYAPFDGMHDFAVARVTASGVLDSSFGDAGFVRVGKHRGFGGAVTHDARGRVIAGGYFSNQRGSDLLLTRLDAKGRPDPSFGVGGLVENDAGSNDQPHAIFARPDGGFVVVGYRSGSKNGAVAFRPDGALDRGFGVNGAATFEADTGPAFATAAALGRDGAIVAGGYLAQQHRGFVARIDARGRPDTGFGNGGVATLDTPAISSAWAVAIDSRSRVLLGGHTTTGPAVVARFTREGRLDATWGKNGIALVAPDRDDQLYALLVDSSERVVGVGFRDLAQEAQALIVRFSPAGVLDASFAERGVFVRVLGGGTFLLDAVWDREGRLVAGGDVWNGDRSRALLLRML
jgi:uncharacterized delta-60 repeat protein